MFRQDSFFGRLWAAIPGALPWLGGAALIALLGVQLMRDAVEVAPISVPPRLLERGITAEVVALRLLDGINEVEDRLRGEPLRASGAEISGSAPDFEVPLAGVSLRSVAIVLRSALGISETRVSGEITLEGEALRLRLRLSGQGVILDEQGESLDELIEAAVPAVWRHTQPELYAWYLAETAASEEELDIALAGLMTRPGNADLSRTVRLLQIRAALRSGRPDQALPQADALLAEFPDHAPALFLRGRALRDMGRLDEATTVIRQAQRLLPRAGFIHVGLAQVLRDRDQNAAALAELAPALLPGRADSQAPTEAAIALVGLGRHAEALAMARRAVAQDARNPSAVMSLGLAQLHLGQPQQALERADRALELSPRWLEARLLRVEALLVLGRTGEARAELEEHQAAIHAVPRLRSYLAAMQARAAG